MLNKKKKVVFPFLEGRNTPGWPKTVWSQMPAHSSTPHRIVHINEPHKNNQETKSFSSRTNLKKMFKILVLAGMSTALLVILAAILG